jgi:release factor glutamine methyltransferase
MEHADLISAPDRLLSDEEQSLLLQLEGQRTRGQPYSRIAGVREFYGRDFRITPQVLDPRPDTESIIELCLRNVSRNGAFQFADLGCGSGAIAVTLLMECPLAHGVAIDVSHAALDVTAQNAADHGVGNRLSVRASNWFAGIDGAFDLIVTNPPYVRSGDIATLDREVREHDPLLALDGGSDGLSCYRSIALQSGAHLAVGGVVVVEAGYGQADDIKYIFRDNGFRKKDEAADLAGIIRALAFCRD